MKKVIFVLLVSLLFCVSAGAQTGTSTTTAAATADEKPRPPIFRPTKDQITEVQTMLKAKGLYEGEAIGKLDKPTRAAIKSWQKDNGLKTTGTLNRATLEKMGIELTERQKTIPVSENSYAAAEPSGAVETDTKVKATANSEPSGETKPKRKIFRATKDQVVDAQKVLKGFGMYSGEETGKLDDDTREGLKKYQEGKGLKITGTLNQATLEKMGIELTDKQKEQSAGN
jgi:peptidoglycan hydrolase-like protein with peptidoglycan-binding domain